MADRPKKKFKSAAIVPSSSPAAPEVDKNSAEESPTVRRQQQLTKRRFVSQPAASGSTRRISDTRVPPGRREEIAASQRALPFQIPLVPRQPPNPSSGSSIFHDGHRGAGPSDGANRIGRALKRLRNGGVTIAQVLSFLLETKVPELKREVNRWLNGSGRDRILERWNGKEEWAVKWTLKVVQQEARAAKRSRLWEDTCQEITNENAGAIDLDTITANTTELLPVTTRLLGVLAGVDKKPRDRSRRQPQDKTDNEGSDIVMQLLSDASYVPDSETSDDEGDTEGSYEDSDEERREVMLEQLGDEEELLHEVGAGPDGEGEQEGDADDEPEAQAGHEDGENNDEQETGVVAASEVKRKKKRARQYRNKGFVSVAILSPAASSVD